jgi:glycosyltransferase involved in cell wall biosynthesis
MTTPAPAKGPKISIVTVTLNAEDSICRTLRSVANQTYPNLEQIVKDGGSTDQTFARVQQCVHPRLHIIVKPDIGIYDAMNQGAAAASGQLVLFLNAGDTLLSPTVLEHFVRTAYRDLDRIYLFAVLTKKRGIRLPRTSWPKVHYMLPAYHQGMLYPKSVFADYPFSTRYRIAGDLEHYLTIKNDWPLENTGIHLAQFDDHGISSTNKKLRNMEYQDIYEKHGVNPLFRAVKRIQDMHDWMRFKLIRRSV